MTGTMTRPPTIAITPELMDDLKIYPRTAPQPVTSTPPSVTKSCSNAIPHPQTKHTTTEILVIPFQYRPYMNGARNAPASAPQDTIKVTSGCASLKIAITADIRIKNTMNDLIMETCFFSDIPCFAAGLMTSNVKVELDVRTREDKTGNV